MILGMKPARLLQSAREAKRQTGRSIAAQMLEIVRLRKGPGKISAREYYDFRLFEPHFTREQQNTFAGSWALSSVWSFQDPQWCGVGSDKLLSYLVLNTLGLPTAPIKAIYGAYRHYPNTVLLKSVEELKSWLRNPENYPFFSKPSAGAYGRNTCYALKYDTSSDKIITPNGKDISVDEFSSMELPYEFGGLLFQDIIRPHPGLVDRIGERVATARIITIRTETGVRVHRAAFRIPVGNNITDNFNLGSGGNGFADIDAADGRLGKMHVGLGLSLQPIEKHPDTGRPVEGYHLPYWKDALDIVKTGQEFLFGLPSLGWDIAFTADGPVIVEFNTTPGYVLLQATGRGFVDADFRRYFPADPKALEKRYPHIETGAFPKRRR